MPVAKGTPYKASFNMCLSFQRSFSDNKGNKEVAKYFFLKGKRVTKIIQTYKIKAPLFAELRFTQ